MIINTIQDYKNLDRQHIFRGQANKDWNLLPGAYRNDSSINSPALEKESVTRFIWHLYENGYRAFPCDLTKLNFLTRPAAVFPIEEILPCWALAQHYAFDSQFSWLKTSLLDVTHNLDIAAYFAVEKKTEEASDGVIFVFDLSKIKKPYKFYEPHGGAQMEARLVVQECAFIYREQTCKYDDYFPYKNKESFDDIIKDTIIIPYTLKSLLKRILAEEVV